MKRPSAFCIGRLLVLLIALGAAGARAEIGRQLTLAEKVEASDAILHARCTGNSTAWRNGKVVTTSRFQVIDDLHGRGMSDVNVVVPGGTAVHPVLQVPVTTRVSDQVSVQPDDEAVLFLRRVNNGEFRLVAGEQAYERVARDDGGTHRVRAAERQLRNESVRGSGTRAADAGTELSAETYRLEDFKTRVRREIASLSTAGKEEVR